MLKTMGVAAAGMAAGALGSAEGAEAQQAVPGEHNAYGAPPGSGVSMPPYYLPTPSVRNKNNYFPRSEPLGPDEMRIIFMGSNPWPPRMSQASTCIMVELGSSKRLFLKQGAAPIMGALTIDNCHTPHYRDRAGELRREPCRDP